MIRCSPNEAPVRFALGFLLLLVSGCGRGLLPKQARFTVGPCEGAAASFPRATWSVQPDPALRLGPAGSWDAVDVLNPSVVRFGPGLVNLYSGFDGAVWRTGIARSSEGVLWERAHDPILSPDPDSWEGDYIAANGAALAGAGGLRYWYQAGPRNATQIGLAISNDGKIWRKEPSPVLEVGATGRWDESAIGDPYVISCGSTFYLYYLGQNRFGVQRLGVARSSDGVRWQKSHLNPILETGGPDEFDERGLGEPAVFATASRFLMLYVGRDDQEERKLGWAESDDGVTWEKSRELDIFEGPVPWSTRVVCDPTILIQNNELFVWFGGGDVASPDENLNGQIGLAKFGPIE